MKALTLHQPWASLIAVGAKRVETRSWSTAYRGPLVIHAGKKRPRGWWSNIWRDQYGLASDVARAAVNANVTFETDGPCWSAEEASDGEHWYHRWRGPLGAVVASAILIDVVPIVDATPIPHRPHVYARHDGVAFLWVTQNWPGVIESESPFGDFTPGRFAWLLDDVARTETRCPWCWGDGADPNDPGYSPPGAGGAIDPGSIGPCPVCSGAGKVDPVPARGGRRLWEWSAPDEEKNR